MVSSGIAKPAYASKDPVRKWKSGVLDRIRKICKLFFMSLSEFDKGRGKECRVPKGADGANFLLQFRGGDREAFTRLHRLYGPRLYGYLLRYTGDAFLAEDLCQETFIRLMEKCGVFEEGKELRPWIYTIATNLAINAQRRGRRDQKTTKESDVSSFLWERHGIQGEFNMDYCRDMKKSSPLAEVLLRETREQVRGAVEQLPPQYRDLLLLRYWQDMSYKQIAEVLGRPIGTVRVLLHRAKAVLKQRLKRLEAVA